MSTYQIFTDATADMDLQMIPPSSGITVIPMEVEIGGHGYTYGPAGDLSVSEFYALQRGGAFASTSQISPGTYFESFEPCLRQGRDLLYLCFSSGMSGTIHSAKLCLDELREQYPERNILCLDTLCASVGEGLVVAEAARKQAEGWSMDELAAWLVENRRNVCHWFTVDTFEHLRHGGRVSSAAAAVGAVLQIKPMLHVDEDGKLAVMEKPRGRKRAMGAQLSRMEQGWTPDRSNLVLIGHGDDPQGAEELRQMVGHRFPEAEIFIADIGPIIGAHTGPGMLALIYWGNNR